VDAIVTPTTPTAAFKIGEKSDDPLQMYLSDIFHDFLQPRGHLRRQYSWSSGHEKPEAAIGLQLLGKPFGEEALLKIAMPMNKHLVAQGQISYGRAVMKLTQRTNKILFFLGVIPAVDCADGDELAGASHQRTHSRIRFIRWRHTYKVLNLVQQTPVPSAGCGNRTPRLPVDGRG